MKKILLVILVLIMSITLVSCVNNPSNKVGESLTQEDFSFVEINEKYWINIPKYMKETDALNDEASLQYQNIFKEAYTIVIEEDKQEFVDMFKEYWEYNDDMSIVSNYRDVQIQFISESMSEMKEWDIISLKIDDLDAEMIEIDSKTEYTWNKWISFLYTFIEWDDNLYMIMSWTLSDRKYKYNNTFEKMAKSFKLLR